MLRRGGERPTRREIERAALELIARHGGEVLATARRYSATVDDAEDAYQRGLEILLKKAPMTAQDELLPWLKTVVKHEAFAVRRQRERAAPVALAERPEEPAPEAEAHTQAERYERLRVGAEALGRLKPHEVRALLLKAEGYSYSEICAITGWSYTKVNRLITEGRRAFLSRVAGIEAGQECGGYEPLLSALADGEASAPELAELRPHLKTCLTCRARLREFRAAPARVAALLPPLALAAEPRGGMLRSWLESLAGAAQHKAAAVGDRVHAAAELAAGQKVAAVAASAAALAGGGAAVEGLEPSPARTPVEHHRAAQAVPPNPEPAVPTAGGGPPVQPAPTAPPQPAALEPPPPPSPANEFAPSPAQAPVSRSNSSSTPRASSGGAGGGGSSGAGEFGP